MTNHMEECSREYPVHNLELFSNLLYIHLITVSILPNLYEASKQIANI